MCGLRGIIKEANFEPPLALRRLAAITDFDLFVSTTFDSLLENGASIWSVSAARPRPRCFRTRPTASPTCRRARTSAAPGRLSPVRQLSASPTYVISDEDLLEFICALQSEHLAPEKLFHELEHNHLLFIGSNFSNWLARLFLRMAKRQRLSDPRDVGEVLADGYTGRTSGWSPSCNRSACAPASTWAPTRFVDELHARWMARRKPAAAGAGRAPARFLPPAREMPENAVFISYAREDLAAVQQIKAGLEAAGITTWFDMDRLEAGDDYDRKIQQQHRPLLLFHSGRLGDHPAAHRGVLPARVELRDRPHAQHGRRRAVYPAGYIDATTAAEALVPDKFKSLHFTHLPGGGVPHANSSSA